MNDNRSRLISVAEESVRRTGLKALSFRTLANVVGIKSSSVHYHFPEKADLARVLIEQYRDKLLLELDQIAGRKLPLRTQFLQFVDIFGSAADDNRVCLLCMMAAEFTSLSTDNQSLLASVFSDLENWLTSLFESRRDELTTDLSSEQLSRLVISGLEGALLVDRVMRNSDRFQIQTQALLHFMK